MPLRLIPLCANVNVNCYIIPFENFKTYLPWLFTYTYNFARWFFFPKMEGAAFSHFWSLTVEEQFYIFWPAVVYFSSQRFLKKVVIFMIIIGPILRGLVAYLDSFLNMSASLGVHICTTSYLDGFAYGAALAIGFSFFCSKPFLKFITAGITLIVAIGVFHIKGIDFLLSQKSSDILIWFFSLIGLTTIFLISSLMQKSFLSKLFNNPLLIYLGKISYGLYVWHSLCLYITHKIVESIPPIYTSHFDDVFILFFRYLSSPSILFLNGTFFGVIFFEIIYKTRCLEFLFFFTFTIGVASLSYHFYEKLFLNLKDKYFPYKSNSR